MGRLGRGVDYRTGKLTYTLADTKCGAEFLAFLIVLVKAYAGQKIRMVCDNGRFHTTKAVQAMARRASGSNRGVLATTLLSQLEFD